MKGDDAWFSKHMIFNLSLKNSLNVCFMDVMVYEPFFLNLFDLGSFMWNFMFNGKFVGN